MQKLNALSLGYASAILAGLCMLALSIAAWLGFYENAVISMQDWHMFYSLSLFGVIGGVIEAAVLSFVGGYVFGLLYNKLTK